MPVAQLIPLLLAAEPVAVDIFKQLQMAFMNGRPGHPVDPETLALHMAAMDAAIAAYDVRPAPVAAEPAA